MSSRLNGTLVSSINKLSDCYEEIIITFDGSFCCCVGILF